MTGPVTSTPPAREADRGERRRREVPGLCAWEPAPPPETPAREEMALSPSFRLSHETHIKTIETLRAEVTRLTAQEEVLRQQINSRGGWKDLVDGLTTRALTAEADLARERERADAAQAGRPLWWAALATKLKEEAERQHARAESAESRLSALTTQIEGLVETWRQRTPDYSQWDGAADELAALLPEGQQAGKEKPMNEIPRRNRIDLQTETEAAIRAARDAVEAMPADVRLTDASNLLGEALEAVADFVDGVEGKRRSVVQQSVTPPPSGDTRP